MSSAGDSDASTQPSFRRPRHSGRKPWGSRTPTTLSSSISTSEKAPSSWGSTLSSARSSARFGAGSPEPPAFAMALPLPLTEPCPVPLPLGEPGWRSSSPASSSAMRSLSDVTVPGSIPAPSASAAVLTRLPLWPRANSSSPTDRYDGWALRQVLDPVVE